MSDSVSFGFDIKDVKTIVDMYLTKASVRYDRMAEKEKIDEVKLTMIGQLKNAVEKLKLNIDNIKKASQTVSYTASVGNSSVVSASLTSNDGLYAATHQLVVSKLASVEVRQCANTVASRNSALSLDGGLTFTIGSDSFAVSVSSTDSLENIRDKINNSISNVGVTASIISSTDALGNAVYSLVVASDKTGIDQQFTASGTLSSTFDFGLEKQAASNAEFTFDGLNVVRSTNAVSDVLDGLSFNLLSMGASSISVTENPSNRVENTKSAIHAMVDSYNAVIGLINNNFAQSAADRIPSDESLVQAKNMLSDLFGKPLNVTPFNSLLSIGIETAGFSKISATPSVKKDSNTSIQYVATGALKINDSVLAKALKDDLAGVIKMFGDVTEGFSKKASGVIDKINNNIVAEKTKSLGDEIRNIKSKMDMEESRLEEMKDRLIGKFSSLLEMVKKSENMSNYIDRQFNSLNPRR